MMIKKHLAGGSLRRAMAEEIRRVIDIYAGEDQAIEKVAIELGVTPRTLRAWIRPTDKGGWEELQDKRDLLLLRGTMERVLNTCQSNK